MKNLISVRKNFIFIENLYCVCFSFGDFGVNIFCYVGCILYIVIIY